MAVLDGFDCSDDELGREEATCVQKGIWEGLPAQEEGYDPVYLLIMVTCGVVLKGCSPSIKWLFLCYQCHHPAKFGLSAIDILFAGQLNTLEVPSDSEETPPRWAAGISPLTLKRQPYPRYI